MLTQQQLSTVTRVYKHLLQQEGRGWDAIDEYVACLEYLEDSQLEIEAQVCLMEHSDGVVTCTHKAHPKDECLIPLLVDAARSVLMYKEGMSKEARYILEHYLAFNQAGMIKVEKL